MKQVLDFIKANVVALTCGVIALLAIVAFFIWPVPSMFAELRTEVEARKGTHDTIDGLLKGNRTLPNVDTSVTEAQPLTAFPTKNVIAEGSKAMQAVKDNAKLVLEQAIKANARPLLVDGVLPNPTSFTRGQFLDAYRRATAQYGEHVDQGIIRRLAKGTLPPTAEELAAAELSAANEIRKNNLQTDNRGVAQNQAQVDALIADMRAQLPLVQRVSRASNFQLYVSPGAVEVHPGMDSVSNLNAVSIFNAQFSLWIQSIVLEAIADANESSKNVLNAPVKHLLSLRVPMNIADPSQGGPMGFGAPTGEPVPAASLVPDASVALTPKFESDPLGYASNSMYDVIRVQLVLRVDASRLAESIAALSQKHLIKVRNVSFRTVNIGGALLEGYYYSSDGSTPIVEVELDCDVLMLRAWVVPYMPEQVKAAFSALSNPVVPQQ